MNTILGRGFNASDVCVGYCVRFYAADDGRPKADVLNQDTGLQAWGCDVARMVETPRAPSRRFEPTADQIDPAQHPLVLVARQAGKKPYILFAVVDTVRVPTSAEGQEHESQASYGNDPELEDDILSVNGGSRFTQKRNGQVCLKARANATVELAEDAQMRIGRGDPGDHAALANPLVDVLEQVLEALAASLQREAELQTTITRIQAFLSTATTSTGGPVIAPGGGGPYVAGSLPSLPSASVTYDLSRLKSDVLRLSEESADG